MRKKYYGLIESIIILTILLIMAGCISVDSLLEKGELEKAAELSAEKEEYIKVANVFFEKKMFEKAAYYYEKANYKQGLNNIADIYLTRDYYDIDKSELYYRKADNREGLINIADIYITTGFSDYEKAIKIYSEVGADINIAYRKIAFEEITYNRYEKAEEYLNKIGEILNNEIINEVADKLLERGGYYMFALELYKKTNNEGKIKETINILAESNYFSWILEAANYFLENNNIELALNCYRKVTNT